MNRKEAAKILPIIKAYAEGKTIQVVDTTDQCGMWEDVIDLKINTDFEEYRIKPEPKYRPFKDAKECWQEMQKHQPFGWTRDNDNDIYDMITRVTNSGILFSGSYFNEITTYDFSYNRVTFADGTPFGVKVEE